MKKLIPVIALKDAADTIPVLRALKDGGVYCAEITFRTACAEEAIRIAASAFPDMEIGAGTVINAEQAGRAVTAGARFLVSPGFDDGVARFALDKGITYYPGCVTPSEIMHALSYGFDILKFFPAGVFGGIKALKALSAPFPQVRFIPTGGVDLGNLKEFIEFDKVYAVGGSFMMKGSPLDITRICKEAMKICES